LAAEAWIAGLEIRTAGTTPPQVSGDTSPFGVRSSGAEI
jgi:hypothetical protein